MQSFSFTILIPFISFYPLTALPNDFRTVLEKKRKKKSSSLSDFREDVRVNYFTV